MLIKKICNSLILMISLVLISLATSAAPKAPTIKAVKTLAVNYLDAIGCSTGDVSPKLLVPFADAGMSLRGFVFITYSDIGCAGGSGTVNPTLLFMSTKNGRTGADDDIDALTIDATVSEPAARVNNAPKQITSLFERNGRLFATGLAYGKDDANCCPSVKSTYTVLLRKNKLTVAKGDDRDVYTWDFVPSK